MDEKTEFSIRPFLHKGDEWRDFRPFTIEEVREMERREKQTMLEQRAHLFNNAWPTEKELPSPVLGILREQLRNRTIDNTVWDQYVIVWPNLSPEEWRNKNL